MLISSHFCPSLRIIMSSVKDLEILKESIFKPSIVLLTTGALRKKPEATSTVCLSTVVVVEN